MKKYGRFLLFALILCVGFLVRKTPVSAASYVECNDYQGRVKAGNYYIWVEDNTICYATSASGAASTLVKTKSGTTVFNCVTNGSTVYYVNYAYNDSGTCNSYIYKYNIAKAKRTLLKKTTGITSVTGFYAGAKTLYMIKGEKIVGLNVSTGKLSSIVSNIFGVYGMSGKYIVYNKSFKLYSYNVVSKTKKLISSKLEAAVMYGSSVYYLEKTNDSYPAAMSFRTCKASGSSQKTIKAGLTGTSASLYNDANGQLYLTIYDTSGKTNGGSWYYSLATGQFVTAD